MVLITGAIVATEANFDRIRELSLEHVQRSRTEGGCEHHAVHVDAENPFRLVFLERWLDTAAVLKHFSDPQVRQFARTVRELAAEPPTIEIYEANRIKLP